MRIMSRASALVATPSGNGKPGRRPKSGRAGKKAAKLSRLRKPEHLSLEAWQVALRRQFAREQKFRVENLGTDPVFSEFRVTNPQTRRSYRVAIRGAGLGDNYCSCPDFSVNTLGTCKHVEFTLAWLARRPGGKRALAAGFHPPYSEIYVRYGAQREVVFRPGAECPPALLRSADKYFDAHGRLRAGAYARFEEFLKAAKASRHELRCYDDTLSLVAQVRDRERLAQRIHALLPRGISSPAFRRLLKVPLYPYQREGALAAARAGRLLMADDMGLGKTVQAVAAAEILARTAGVERVLVIAPTSLKHQWRREIERFTDRQALVVEGLLPRRAELYAAESFYKIANYDIVYRDLERIQAWRPDLIVLDEAQRIKNWKTRTAQSVKRLESPYALVLTGTPLENRLEELYSIVEFVDRYRLGPMFRFLDAHQHVDATGRVVGYRDLHKITQTLEPILVRRTKDKVLAQLPERMEKRLFVGMTAQQQEHHEENRATVARIVHKWRRFGFLTEADQRRLLIALQNMRMACDSTYLLDQNTDHGVKADELVELLGEMFEDPQAKVVVFSQWLRMHQLVARRLERKRWPYVLFHGGVPGPQRRALIDRFRDDPQCRLFLATDAGGVGLNLQHASAVVNLDLPWNPAVLEQRIGRVHRLGQHRPVRVVNFVAQGTIEEGMLGLLEFKKSVFSGVLDGGQSEVFLGGTRLTRFIESVEKATASVSAPMPAEPEPEAAAEPHPSVRRGSGKKPSGPSPAASARDAAPQAWQELFQAGMSLVKTLSQAFDPHHPAAERSPWIERDERTGQACLKLPLPSPDQAAKLHELLADLTKLFST
jgi:superfamily II DNA or RNA helicase